MLDSNEVFNNKYYILNKKLLMVICIWPYQKKSFKKIVRIFIILAIHSMMIPQLLRSFEELRMEQRNLEILVENLAGFLYFQGILSKFYMSILGEEKLQKIYEQITTDWNEIEDMEEKAVLCSSWNIGRLLTIFYIIYVFTAGISFVTLPAVIPSIVDLILPRNESRPKSLCYYSEYYIDQDKYFYYLLLHTFVCVSCTILIITAVDSTFVSCVYHALGLFNILEHRMNQIFRFVHDEFGCTAMYTKEELHKYVIDSVKIHNKTIEFSDLIQTSYTNCFFFVTGLILIMLSVGSIDLVMNLHNPINFIRIGFVWCGVIIYLFFVSWPGQRLVDSSRDLFDKIYFSGWYRCPIKTQYLMKFMMMRCTIPCQLTAGPLIQMNIVTCGQILKTALSYFTVVASFS